MHPAHTTPMDRQSDRRLPRLERSTSHHDLGKSRPRTHTYGFTVESEHAKDHRESPDPIDLSRRHSDTGSHGSMISTHKMTTDTHHDRRLTRSTSHRNLGNMKPRMHSYGSTSAKVGHDHEHRDLPDAVASPRRNSVAVRMSHMPVRNAGEINKDLDQYKAAKSNAESSEKELQLLQCHTMRLLDRHKYRRLEDWALNERTRLQELVAKLIDLEYLVAPHRLAAMRLRCHHRQLADAPKPLPTTKGLAEIRKEVAAHVRRMRSDPLEESFESLDTVLAYARDFHESLLSKPDPRELKPLELSDLLPSQHFHPRIAALLDLYHRLEDRIRDLEHRLAHNDNRHITPGPSTKKHKELRQNCRVAVQEGRFLACDLRDDLERSTIALKTCYDKPALDTHGIAKKVMLRDVDDRTLRLDVDASPNESEVHCHPTHTHDQPLQVQRTPRIIQYQATTDPFAGLMPVLVGTAAETENRKRIAHLEAFHHELQDWARRQEQYQLQMLLCDDDIEYRVYMYPHVDKYKAITATHDDRQKLCFQYDKSKLEHPISSWNTELMLNTWVGSYFEGPVRTAYESAVDRLEKLFTDIEAPTEYFSKELHAWRRLQKVYDFRLSVIKNWHLIAGEHAKNRAERE